MIKFKHGEEYYLLKFSMHKVRQNGDEIEEIKGIDGDHLELTERNKAKKRALRTMHCRIYEVLHE